MKCEEIENKILEYLDGLLLPPDRLEVASHLGTCAHCQRLARQFQQLDQALMTGIARPRLSADFDRRMQEKIQTLTPVLSPAQKADLKQKLQIEFETGLARIRQTSFAWRPTMNRLAWPLLGIIMALIAWHFTLELTTQLRLGPSAPTLPWLAGSLAFLCTGLTGLIQQNRTSIRFW